ncbi:unnamed protein product [Rotaria sp. Silwood2]|nr:unnamed protein product [Rotaria sp. Silwood2]CAF4300711.1 unnamed protein product [Rotaria sp. Silwood2]
MKDLANLSSEQSITAIDGILLDISFRNQCLLPRYELCTSLLKNRPQLTVAFGTYLRKADEMLNAMPSIQEKLNLLRGNLKAVNRYIDEYDICLRDEKFRDINCSRFIILLEKLRRQTEYHEIKTNFPQLIGLSERWQKSDGIGDHFEPKVINLFQAIDNDVNKMFENKNFIYLFSYRIGIIGDGSVGKTALMMALANIDKNIFSTVDIDRSTFNYLQFDTRTYRHPQSNKIVPITFIDLQGATDVKDSESIGSYIELISIADCDLYLIAFDKPFSKHNRRCQEHIENTLRRKYILVRTKTDMLFSEFMKKKSNNEHRDDSINDYDSKIALSDTRQNASISSDRERLSDKIYLTAAGCDDMLKNSPLFTFDLEKLKKKLIRLAIKDTRVERMFKITFSAFTTTINTCFRRGYIVSSTRYQWIAAACSLIPFLDELPAFYGREKIRQAFGIHGNSTQANTSNSTTTSIEKYLIEKKFTVPKSYLISGCFEYLWCSKEKQSMSNVAKDSNESFQLPETWNSKDKSVMSQNTKACIGHAAYTAIGRTALVLGAIGKALDDVLPIVVPASVAALRAASIAGIVIGAVLTPAFALWSFYSTGKRMNEHLHVLCDDLLVIAAYFLAAIYNSHINITRSPEILSFEQALSGADESSSDEE